MQKKIIWFTILTCFYFGTIMMIYARIPTKVEIAEQDLIRVHVIANSDSAYDQALKIKVRDEILIQLRPQVQEIESIEQAKTTIEENLGNIEQIAKETIKANGEDYNATAILETKHYGQRTTGALTLEEGDYLALNIKLGSAQGQNWWGVLYPALCFNESVTNVDLLELQKVYKEKQKDKKYHTDIKIKLKIFELFQKN